MNGFMKITTCCVLIGSGCQTTHGLNGWSHKDEQKNSAASEQLASRIEKTTPGLPDQALLSTASNRSVEEQIRQGQKEVATYYDLKKNADPVMAAQAAKHLPLARESFAAALTQSPQSASAHHGLAIVADLEQNYAEAERHYLRALTQRPNDSDILADLGYSYLLQKRYAESEQYSQRAIQANANNKSAMKHLGDAYARQGKTQLARETYAKVYAHEEIDRVLAQNAPDPTPAEPIAKANSSIFDRLVPGKSPAEKLQADIQRRQAEYEQQPRPQKGPIRPTQPPGGDPQFAGHQSQESLLRAQIEAIDREAMTDHRGGPLLIDGQTGQMTRLPGAEQIHQRHGSAIANANFGPMELQVGAPATRADNPRDPARYPDRQSNSPYFIDGPDHPAVQQGQGPSPQFNNMAAAGPFTGRYEGPHQYTTDRIAPQGMSPAPSEPPQAIQPWNGIQQATGNNYPSDRTQVDQAYYQNQAMPPNSIQQANAQSFTGLPGAAMNGLGPGPAPNPAFSTQMQAQSYQAANAMGRPGNLNVTSPASAPMAPQGYNPAMGAGWPQGPNSPGGQMYPNGSSGQGPQSSLSAGQGAASPGGNPYQIASREAARMGMGMGPGGVFPVIQNSSPAVNPPGSMSYESSNTPPPQRWMPDQAPPPNLNDAFQPYPNSPRPPASTQLGPTPAQVYPSYTKEQFGTASRYNTETMLNSNIPRDYNNSMREYEAQRWEAGQEANMAVKEIWNQGPINSPLSSTAGSQYTMPNTQGMMYTPNANGPNGTIPEQWPNSPYSSQMDVTRNTPVTWGLQEPARQSASMNSGLPSTALPANTPFANQPQNPANFPGQNLNAPGGTMAPSGRPSPSNQQVVIPSDYRASQLRQDTMYRDTEPRMPVGDDQGILPRITPASR